MEKWLITPVKPPSSMVTPLFIQQESCRCPRKKSYLTVLASPKLRNIYLLANHACQCFFKLQAPSKKILAIPLVVAAWNK